VVPTDGSRNLLGSLNRQPEHTWPDGVVHHGARVLLLLLLAAGTYIVFPLAPVADVPSLERGMLVEEDVVAEVPFTVHKSPQVLAQEREEAAAAVPPTFRYDSTAMDTMRARVNGLLTRLDSAAASAVADVDTRRVLAAYSLPNSAEAIALVRSQTNRAALHQSLLRVIDEPMRRGVANPSDLDDAVAPQIRLFTNGIERLVQRDSLLTATNIYQADYLPRDAPVGLGSIQQLVLIRLFTPTLRLDRIATEAARQAARDAVNTVMHDVIRGERVITARERLLDEDIERLHAYQSRLAELGRFERGITHFVRVTGSVLLNLLILLALGTAIFLFRPDVYRDMRQLLLLAAMLLAITAAAGIIVKYGAPPVLIPIAFPALVAAVLWGGRFALLYALIVSILLAGQSELAGPSARILLFAGGGAAALSVRAVHRRAQALILGLVVAGAYAAATLGLGLVLGWSAGEVVGTVAWGTVNGLASAVFALGLLPIFEAITNITTDQTLLELADLNRPLLKRLSLEAPGTYAHSINVANLAEAAARAVNANPLLVRTGAYYHDVGKVLAPQFYVENQARGRNPHDELDPATSASVVRQHVVEGLRLAEQANLPDAVKSFITEHHGSQRIGFFYDRARERNPGVELDPADFSYPGPRPRTSETAIVMLADSLESAAKVLPEPSPESIRGLVDRIVDAKLAQHQLDDAPLTLDDLTRIKEQFVLVLNGMYHHRLDYPPLPRREPVREVEATTTWAARR
jgi:putative nucleotidyltransferase with HDIG domain